MNNKIKTIKKQIAKNEKVIAAVRGARAFWRAGTIVVPAAAAVYLALSYGDIIITALAVLLGLYAISNFVRAMWLAELNAASK